MAAWILGNYILGLLVTLTILLSDKSLSIRKTKAELAYWCTYPLWGGFSSVWFLLTLIWFTVSYLIEQIKLQRTK